MNLLGIEPWLSIRQADTLTGVPIVLTDVFWLLILLISYINSCTVLKPYLTHTRVCIHFGKTLNLLGIESWLSIRQADALTAVQIVLTDVF